MKDEASGNTPLHYAIMMLDGEKEGGRSTNHPPIHPPTLCSSIDRGDRGGSNELLYARGLGGWVGD